MRVISNEKTVFFDVDQTLVDKVYSVDGTAEYDIELDYYGELGRYKTLKKNIQQIKAHKERGWFVIVWTHSGPEWGRQVVEKLGLEDYVDIVCNKPLKHFDDLPANEWMGERVFLKE